MLRLSNSLSMLFAASNGETFHYYFLIFFRLYVRIFLNSFAIQASMPLVRIPRHIVRRSSRVWRPPREMLEHQICMPCRLVQAVHWSVCVLPRRSFARFICWYVCYTYLCPLTSSEYITALWTRCYCHHDCLCSPDSSQGCWSRSISSPSSNNSRTASSWPSYQGSYGTRQPQANSYSYFILSLSLPRCFAVISPFIRDDLCDISFAISP